jgi:RNA polymerase sigma-70 factor (ECF subfamily)
VVALGRAVRLQDLIDAVAEGDRSALAQIYTATNRQAYGAVLRILRKRDDAVAATEEAYVRIWRDATTYNPKLLSPLDWIVMTARAAAFDFARRHDDLRLATYRGAMETEGDAEAASAEISPELRKLLGVFGELSEDKRRMMLLAYYDGWSREALSVEFDAQPGTIRTWLLRSLEHIRERAP